MCKYLTEPGNIFREEGKRAAASDGSFIDLRNLFLLVVVAVMVMVMMNLLDGRISFQSD